MGRVGDADEAEQLTGLRPHVGFEGAVAEAMLGPVLLGLDKKRQPRSRSRDVSSTVSSLLRLEP